MRRQPGGAAARRADRAGRVVRVGARRSVPDDGRRSAQDGRRRHRRDRRRRSARSPSRRAPQAGKAAGKKVEAPEPHDRLPRHHRRHRVGRPRPQLAPRRVQAARREVALLRRPGHAHEVGHLRQQPARPEDRRARPDRHRPVDDPVGRSGRQVEGHPDRRLRRHGRARATRPSSRPTRSRTGRSWPPT